MSSSNNMVSHHIRQLTSQCHRPAPFSVSVPAFILKVNERGFGAKQMMGCIHDSSQHSLSFTTKKLTSEGWRKSIYCKSLRLQHRCNSALLTHSVAAFIEKVSGTVKVGCEDRERWKFLDADGGQVMQTFSSFISCCSLCIGLVGVRCGAKIRKVS